MQPFQRTAAIFDLDDSLLDGNAGAIFTWYLYSNRLMRDEARRTLPRAVYNFARRKLSESDMVALASRCHTGLRADELRAHARACFARHVKKRVTRDGLHAVQRHLALGHYVLVASGSPQMITDEVAQFLHAHEAIGTRAAFENGVCTGEILTPMVFQLGKRERVREVAARLGLDLGRSYLYSDSVADTPLFEEVGHPTVVNPKTAFRAEALRRGWPVVKWDGRLKTDPGDAEPEQPDEWPSWEA